MISAPPKDPAKPASEGVEPAELQRNFVKAGRFTAGMMTRYRASLLTGEPAHQRLATGFAIGARFHSAPGRPPRGRQADAARARVPGGRALAALRLRRGGGPGRSLVPPRRPLPVPRNLARIRRSASTRPKAQDMDAVIDVRAIVQQGHRDLALASMPPLLLPRKGRYGLIDYEKLFCPDLKTRPTFSSSGASIAPPALSSWCGPTSTSPTSCRSTAMRSSAPSSAASCWADRRRERAEAAPAPSHRQAAGPRVSGAPPGRRRLDASAESGEGLRRNGEFALRLRAAFQSHAEVLNSVTDGSPNRRTRPERRACAQSSGP